MPLLILAFLFYLVGTIGVIIENAGEFWLWFLAFGLVLDLTLLLLAVTGLKGLEFIRKVEFKGRISHILALVLAITGIWLRLKAETTWFFILIGLGLLFWIYSLVILKNFYSRRT